MYHIRKNCNLLVTVYSKTGKITSNDKIYKIHLLNNSPFVMSTFSAKNAQENIDRLQSLIDSESDSALKLAYIQEKIEWIKKLPISTDQGKQVNNQ
jgi:hypothetical protein